MFTDYSSRSCVFFRALSLLSLVWGFSASAGLAQVPGGPPPLVHHVRGATERLEMTINTSRILTLDQNIPTVQVNNPEILSVTVLSARQVQISARRAGVTQVNLQDEQGSFHTVDVIVYGDTRELTELLQHQFPTASIRIIPLQNGLLLTGYLDDPSQMSQVVAIANSYSPSIINNIRIGGVQQVLLHVKVMEVSRTKLRTLGFDFANLSPTTFVASGISGMLGPVAAPLTGTLDATSITGNVLTPGVSAVGETFSFGVVDSGNAFFGFLEMLRQNNVAKILAEPDLVTVSGRPASFNSGGEFPILVPQSLGTVSIQYRSFGTQVDFVPIVLGNGAIRLEVRPRVSEIDDSRSVTINNTNVPALRVRQVDTGVEMKPGQTLAIAGLVQSRSEASSLGVPFLSDLPWVGALFRRNRELMNEIELLILVTPQLVEALDCHEMPCGGPGLDTRRPTDCELFFKGQLEVETGMPVGYDSVPMGSQEGGVPPHATRFEGESLPRPENLPPGTVTQPETRPTPPPNGANNPVDTSGMTARANSPSSSGTLTASRRLPQTYSGRPPATPAASGSGERYSRSSPNGRTSTASTAKTPGQPGFIGPLGYDVN